MRQETIIKTWLKFSELSDEGKRKAIDNNRDISVDYGWWDFVFEDYTIKLKKLGFWDIKLYFTGFSSQGDGACFTAKHKRGYIEHRGHYYHENSMRCDNDVLLEVARRIAQDLYSTLEKNYEYYTSDECVAESIEANDCEFDAEKYEAAQ